MSLFLNTSSLHNHYFDCCSIDVSETIEHDCLSVLHKLHDQVNGLQLVQVVVQPLARLFNPASLAAFVSKAAPSQLPSSFNSNPSNTSPATAAPGNQSNASTPSSQPPLLIGSSHHNYDLDGLSTTTGTSLTTAGSSNQSHSRSQSFASAFNASGGSSNSNNINNNNNLLISTTSTYMMSPDTAQALIARLDTDRDVNWLMEIIGYGLSMPFSLTGEQDSVRDCCTIYCEWLASALLPYNENNEDSKYQQLSKLVPIPIRKDPNRYARKMLSHLYNVFLPRQHFNLSTSNSSQKDNQDVAALTAVSRQAVLCHRVLRTIESIAQNHDNLMDHQTWDHLLALLLTVNDKLLSAPTEPDDIGTQLHDRTLGVLFELILLASAKSIPTPDLWKTFHEMSLNWRHRPALVDHWRRITLLITKRIVLLSSPASRQAVDHKNNDASTDDLDYLTTSALELAVASMSYENLSQTWYRFLNLIGNPVDLSDPNIISRTDEFYHSACAFDNVLDPRQHPCLSVLPQVFMNSMSGLRDLVDTFLGTYQDLPREEQSVGEMNTTSDKPPSYSQSARGSIVSLNSKTILSTVGQQAPQLSHQQLQSPQQPFQPQALTPTQARKTGIKSITIKGTKVTPFTSSFGSHSNTHTDINQRQQQQFNQPRPSITSLNLRNTPQNQQQQPLFKLSPQRPKCNSILHVFGDWLFCAALIGSDLSQEIADNHDHGSATSQLSLASTATEISGHRSFSPSPSVKRSSIYKSTTSSSRQGISSKQQDGSTSGNSSAEKIMLEPPLTADSFEFGQAEAMAILCKIFSSKASSEEILPAYLSRFYLCLQHCLTFGSGQDTNTGWTISPIKRQLLSSVLVNSTTLLQKDLDGINLLIPSFIKAIEFVFECNEKDNPLQPPLRQQTRSGSIRVTDSNSMTIVTNYDLRRACILTLMNLLAYPFHFKDLVIRNCLNEASPTTTFESLRPRLLKLLFVALQTETDPNNMQILFAGLSLTIHDLATNTRECDGKDDTLTNLSSRSDSNSVNSGSESGRNSLESRRDDSSSQNSFVFNSSGGFLVKSLHVTCHLLINIWKHDTQVSLAALELLTAIARVSTSYNLLEQPYFKSSSKYSYNNNKIEMKSEYKQTSKWICDYICNQCSRPPPAHSRDMHSTIVAAYQCLSVWFYHHPYLLNDESCVNTLLEVIELGVSGQKSKSFTINPVTGIAVQSIVTKSEKIMKPSSMRVREAAESLLNICMVRARSPQESLSKIMSTYDTVLDERSVAELFCGVQYKTNLRHIQDTEQRRLEAYKLFKYFSDEDSNIIGLLEGMSHDPLTRDSVICLMRTQFGKHCWKLKFNYYTEKSREKIIANKTLGLIKRPFQQCSTPTSEMRIFSVPGAYNKSLYFNNSAKFFPSSLDDIPSNELDHLVTTLNSYSYLQGKDSRLKSDLDKISKLFNHQVVAEQKVINECTIRVKRVDCEEPQPLNDLEVVRILVTHLGLKTAISPMLQQSDHLTSNFVNELNSLDQQSVRTCDCVHIFYVRKNRTSPQEILESVRERHNVSLSFFEWILELGQPTVVKYHNRWTGKASNSWCNRNLCVNQVEDSKASLSRNQMLSSNHGGAIFDGDRMTLYWSDMCQELAFLIPHKVEKERSNSYQHQTGCETNIIICWLECHDDKQDVPCDTLLSLAETGFYLESSNNSSSSTASSEESSKTNIRAKARDYAKYFISPMKNGLYRINLVTSFNRHWLALPLVDGMTVSKGILSSLIRESIINLCRRRRLDADSYQPPHVKRRIKIQDICTTYKISSRCDPTEFYNNLFKGKHLPV